MSKLAAAERAPALQAGRRVGFAAPPAENPTRRRSRPFWADGKSSGLAEFVKPGRPGETCRGAPKNFHLTKNIKFVSLDILIMKKNPVSIAAVGQSLAAHAKNFELDGSKRGLVVELFPAIFAASERMSARAIGRFLQERHGVKLSVVTIGKALNDPRRYWNLFFDLIEPSVAAYEREERSARRAVFLFDDPAFKAVQFPGREFLRQRLLKYEFTQAIGDLREKWFSIDHAVRLKARPYLAERLLGKAQSK